MSTSTNAMAKPAHDEGAPLFRLSAYVKGRLRQGPAFDAYIGPPVWAPSLPFGAYTCGLPMVLVNATMASVGEFHARWPVEWALFTGGCVAEASHWEDCAPVVRTMAQWPFPVIPTVASRDVPWHNSLAFHHVADEWADANWLDLTAIKRFRYHHTGYAYTTERDLKVVVLNSQAWDPDLVENYRDVSDPDPHGVWHFLVDELVDSEQNNQRVWILAHRTPARGMPLQSAVFAKIVTRFLPRVIGGIFFGEGDEFLVLYKNSTAVNHALHGPSLSPLGGFNPAWRYYEVDTHSMEVVGVYTYSTALGEPEWRREYEAGEMWAYQGRDTKEEGVAEGEEAEEEIWQQFSLGPSEKSDGIVHIASSLDHTPPLSSAWWAAIAESLVHSPHKQLFQRLYSRGGPAVVLRPYCRVTLFTTDAYLLCIESFPSGTSS